MKPKRLPRLWCALQGLLPFDACLAAQRGELAWPREENARPETDAPDPGESATAAQARREGKRERP